MPGSIQIALWRLMLTFCCTREIGVQRRDELKREKYNKFVLSDSHSRSQSPPAGTEDASKSFLFVQQFCKQVLKNRPPLERGTCSLVCFWVYVKHFLGYKYKTCLQGPKSPRLWYIRSEDPLRVTRGGDRIARSQDCEPFYMRCSHSFDYPLQKRGRKSKSPFLYASFNIEALRGCIAIGVVSVSGTTAYEDGHHQPPSSVWLMSNGVILRAGSSLHIFWIKSIKLASSSSSIASLLLPLIMIIITNT